MRYPTGVKLPILIHRELSRLSVLPTDSNLCELRSTNPEPTGTIRTLQVNTLMD